jgi:hypothetical protein
VAWVLSSSSSAIVVFDAAAAIFYAGAVRLSGGTWTQNGAVAIDVAYTSLPALFNIAFGTSRPTYDHHSHRWDHSAKAHAGGRCAAPGRRGRPVAVDPERHALDHRRLGCPHMFRCWRVHTPIMKELNLTSPTCGRCGHEWEPSEVVPVGSGADHSPLQSPGRQRYRRRRRSFFLEAPAPPGCAVPPLMEPLARAQA